MHKKQQNNYLLYCGIAVAFVVYIGSSFGTSEPNGEAPLSVMYVLSIAALTSLPIPFFSWWCYQKFNKKYLLLLSYLFTAIALASLLYIFTQ